MRDSAGIVASMSTLAGGATVLVHQDGPAARVTLNRPDKRNALSLETMQELLGVLQRIGADDGVRAIVIDAAGPAFSAGHDLGEMIDRDLAFYERLFDVCSELMQTIHRIPQPVIAQVEGIATAAGCQLVAACDLAVAAEHARFATPGVKIGLFCSTPMVPLSRAIGRKRALDMLLTGQPIDARTALDWGLVNRVVPADAVASRGRRDRRRHSRLEPAHGRHRQGGVLRADRGRRAERVRPHQGRDGDERPGRRRAGGHVRLPREASADLARQLTRTCARMRRWASRQAIARTCGCSGPCRS